MTARCPTCDREAVDCDRFRLWPWAGRLDGADDSIGDARYECYQHEVDWRARALAAEARIATVTATIEHDVAICRGHQAARATGGQTCGTGGALTAAQPSMLAYLERAVRDLRDTTDRAAALELKP